MTEKLTIQRMEEQCSMMSHHLGTYPVSTDPGLNSDLNLNLNFDYFDKNQGLCTGWK